MKPRFGLLALLIWALVFPVEAFAVRAGGYNAPSRKLEDAFKVIGGVRAASDDGCYLPPNALATKIDRWGNPNAAVAPDFASLPLRNTVYVISSKARCGRVRMALRARGRTYVLNTAGGEVYVLGKTVPEVSENQSGGRGPLRDLAVISRRYRFVSPNKAQRLVVECPQGRFPLGGGMSVSPGIGGDGESVYPQSYERLGVQRGYHITAIGIDPSPDHTMLRHVSIQAVCGRGLVPSSSPHRTVFVRKNETNSTTVSCPRGEYLFAGGYQRTNFSTPWLTFGGNFATESRAIGPRTWRVSGAAAGHDGGELVAIAYCARSRVPLITEVSTTVSVPRGQAATATTPSCPPGHAMGSGGFSFGGSRQTFFAGGAVNLRRQTWSAAGFGYLVEAPAMTKYSAWPAADFGYLGDKPDLLTAHGYCLRVVASG
jgi:hypothetical protein